MANDDKRTSAGLTIGEVAAYLRPPDDTDPVVVEFAACSGKSELFVTSVLDISSAAMITDDEIDAWSRAVMAATA
jgi:hypothetical protein